MKREPVPIWVHAPVGRDAALLKGALRGSGEPVYLARDTDDIRLASREDRLGVLVLTSEALTPPVLAAISDHVTRSPRWAELPIILLVDAANNTVSTLERLQDALPRTKLLVLQRPVRPSAVDSAIEIMRLSRLRQYALRDYIERQEVLRRELNHRVKNILATVQAMYGLTLRVTSDLDEFDSLFQGRLRAMSDVHDLLHAASYTGTSLREAIGSVLRPYAGDERVVITDGAAVEVAPEPAQSIGLMMHELATNAVKYGALRGEDGRVSIDVQQDDGSVVVVWREAGGPEVALPGPEGYGTTFVKATVRSLGGTVDYDYRAGGLTVRFVLPTGTLAGQNA